MIDNKPKDGLKEMTISIARLNTIALGVIIPVLVFLFLYIRWNWTSIYETIRSSSSTNTIIAVVSFFVMYILAIVLHELIHGLFFALFAKGGFKSVMFGVIWQFLTPYCHCKEAVTAIHYRITLLMPTLILGFIPLMLGLIFNSLMLVLLGCMMILGGTGDFALWWTVRKLPKNTIIYDHPSKIGFYYHNNSEEEEA